MKMINDSTTFQIIHGNVLLNITFFLSDSVMLGIYLVVYLNTFFFFFCIIVGVFNWLEGCFSFLMSCFVILSSVL